MSDHPQHDHWPSLLSSRQWPERLKVEQGIWGKVHGAPSDFRWMGRSSGFDLAGPETVLGVGAEDLPRRCFYWRVLEDRRVLAVAAYPSRAVDAAGRTGFLERRLVLACPPPDLPVAAVALALLATVKQLSASGVPLERVDVPSTEGTSSMPDATLPTLQVDTSREITNQRVSTAIGDLVDQTTESELMAFYQRLLAAERPARLLVQRPLSAAALAGLLLPLSTDEISQLSLAGWIPSSRISAQSLAGHWSVAVGSVSGVRSKQPTSSQIERAQNLVRRLRSGLPPASDSAAPEPSPQEDAANVYDAVLRAQAWLDTVRDFCLDAQWRWLDLETLPPISPTDDPAVESWLLSRRVQVARSMPESADAWQWTVKLDLLAALLVAVAPGSTECQRLRFESGRVPPLLFVARLGPADFSEWRQRAGQKYRLWLQASRSTSILTRHFELSRFEAFSINPRMQDIDELR